MRVLGSGETLNQSLEKAARVDDFFALGALLARDALEREESCGGHFREEHQNEDGEAKRNDDKFSHVAAWECTGDFNPEIRNVEELVLEEVHPTTRSYK